MQRAILVLFCVLAACAISLTFFAVMPIFLAISLLLGVLLCLWRSSSMTFLNLMIDSTI